MRTFCKRDVRVTFWYFNFALYFVNTISRNAVVPRVALDKFELRISWFVRRGNIHGLYNDTVRRLDKHAACGSGDGYLNFYIVMAWRARFWLLWHRRKCRRTRSFVRFVCCYFCCKRRTCRRRNFNSAGNFIDAVFFGIPGPSRRRLDVYRCMICSQCSIRAILHLNPVRRLNKHALCCRRRYRYLNFYVKLARISPVTVSRRCNANGACF